MERVGIVIPMYNEEENVETILTSLVRVLEAEGLEAVVLVVDDGSTDTTPRLLEASVAEHSYIRVLTHDVNRGLGVAITDGAKALKDEVDVIVFMDGDLTHDPLELTRLLAAVETADLVIGSRFAPGGSVVGVPAFRRALSWISNPLFRLLLGNPVSDVTSGYRAVRSDVWRTIDPSSTGFTIQVETASQARNAGFRLAEVPITLTFRERGSSKFHLGPSMIIGYLSMLARLVVGRFGGGRR